MHNPCCGVCVYGLVQICILTKLLRDHHCSCTPSSSVVNDHFKLHFNNCLKLSTCHNAKPRPSRLRTGRWSYLCFQWNPVCGIDFSKSNCKIRNVTSSSVFNIQSEIERSGVKSQSIERGHQRCYEKKIKISLMWSPNNKLHFG